MKQRTSKMIYIYAALMLIGVLSTMYQNILFMIEHNGFSLNIFLLENYVNHASASITNDFIVAFTTFLIWSYRETKRLNMNHWWIYLVLTFGVGFAFSFPLFLLMREKKLYLGNANITAHFPIDI